MDSIDISIVTYNSEKWLDRFIESLLAQSVPTSKISLLWRDNGSTDETLDRLKILKSKFDQEFQRFLIQGGENIGFGAAHNSNFSSVEQDFFLVTNVDLEFEHDTLRKLIDATQSEDSDNVAAWECRQKPYEHPKDYSPVTGDTAWCSSACILFRSSAFSKIEGYESRIFLYGEDVEISYRLRDHGYKLKYVPNAVVWHHTYEFESQVKPQQFLGSTYANILIRCRYGNLRECIAGFVMYTALFLMRPQFPAQRLGVLKGLVKLVANAPFFLASRKKSGEKFYFRLWDYSPVRHGAFYPLIRNEFSEDTPIVSVLVRTMPGNLERLREAISSIEAQTYPGIEVVIVEDGGNSVSDFAESLTEKQRFVAVRYQALEKVGRCLAGNAALGMATGRLICFLDDDDLFYADHIEVLVQAWLAHPDLGAVYGLGSQVRTRVIDPQKWVYQNLDKQLLYRQKFSRTLLWHHNYLPIQTVLFDRNLYDTLGGFDPDLENLEDWNLWVRYSLNHDFLMVDKETSLYRVPAVSEKALERQAVLDDYYAVAQAKHAKLKVEVSPPDVVAFAEELGRELYLVALPAERFRRILARVPGFRFVYHPARTIWYLLRRLRAKR